MHMADSLLSPGVAATMAVASTGVALYSYSKVRKEFDPEKIPVMGVMGSFVFATQMINFTIPGTGSSGHLTGGLLLTAILGPEAGFLTMIGVLALQCLLFADGGLMALGANIWNMSFYGCFIGSIIWKYFNKNISKKTIIISSILGSILSLTLGAFSVTLETLLSGITELPFTSFFSLMIPIHIAIGFVEGLISSAVLIFIYQTRPEILWGVESHKTDYSLRKVLLILGITTLFIGGGLSLYASSHPDGLEWSIEKMTGSTEIRETSNPIQEFTALLPDYNFKEESDIGTTFSGILGASLIFGASLIVSIFIKHKGKQRE